MSQLRFLGIVAVFWISPWTSLHAEVIGSDPTIGAGNYDGGVGKVYIYNGSFTTPGTASSFDFFSEEEIHVTPLLFQVTNGDTFTISGVGASVLSDMSGHQTSTFNLLVGSASVGSGYTFGFYTGLVSASGGSITQDQPETGAVPEEDDGGPWLFVGDITPSVDSLDPGTVFKILDGSQGGGSGTPVDPYNLWSANSNNGRTYHMNLTSTTVPAPEPSSLVLAGSAILLVLRVTRRHRCR